MLIRFISIVVAFMAATALADTTRYTSIWTPQTGANYLTKLNTWESLLNQMSVQNRKGNMLIDVEVKASPGGNQYSGLWVGGGGPSRVTVRPHSSFESYRMSQRNLGYRLHDIEIVQTGHGVQYLGVWNPGEGREEVFYNLSLEDLNVLGEILIADGYLLVDYDVRQSGNDLLYVAVFQDSFEQDGANLFHGPLKGMQFNLLEQMMANQGKVLRDYERVVNTENQVLHISSWRSEDIPYFRSTPRSWD